MSLSSEIDLLTAICQDYFEQRGYKVKKEPSLHPHVRWRPQILAIKGREALVFDVRLTPSMPKFFREIIRSARRLLPDFKVYMAIPADAAFRNTYVKQTKSLGAGLFLIDGTVLREKVKPEKPKGLNFVSTPSGKRAQAIILRPESRFAAWVEISQVLTSASRYVKLIDPYSDEGTLKNLLHANRNVDIRLITAFSGSRRSQESVFKAACQVFKKDYPCFEALKCSPTLIHDRYCITEKETWMLGPSVKDAGSKFGCLARIDDAKARTDIEEFFDHIWNLRTSTKII